MGFILMYDITNEESFNAVQDWWVETEAILKTLHWASSDLENIWLNLAAE